jgi:hypothetical protein
MLLRALLGAALTATGLLAQGERITLRAAPLPNQTIRLAMSQEMAFDVVTEGSGGMGPMRIEGSMSFLATQRVGAPDAAGRVTSQLTMDSVTMNMTLNGAAAPGGAELLRGKTFTIVYDAAGKVVEVIAPPELGMAAASAKEMLSAVSGAIPGATLAIGDTVSALVRIPLPLPMGSGPGEIESRTTSRLVAVTREGGDRIATLQQTTVGESSLPMDFPGPGGSIAPTAQLKMHGGGSLQLDVDKGFVKQGSSEMQMEMLMNLQNVTMKLNGIVKVHVTGTPLPPG